MKKGLLALAVFAMAGSASAATNDPFVQDKATLRLDGLDLSTVDGQQRLAIRMDQAARAVCGDDNLATVHLTLGASARECRNTVIADIRSQIEARMAAKASQTRFASSR
ncbi:UrcA family protein [Erythrobacter sp. SG61-1L]|uniref:UrcA family protein n=1 Tax=Erythrobacter sp. SG61-1L TaxID=1603897 RepID=UPI000A914790|nr:UrcA family protein [Erythrobacter sp. SG61-1L]